MLLIRYKLSLNGNELGVGLVEGLRQIGVPPIKVCELTERLDSELPVPNCNIFRLLSPLTQTKTYFTEYGNTYFSSEITDIMSVVSQYGYTILTETIDIDLNDTRILYRDDYQCLLTYYRI